MLTSFIPGGAANTNFSSCPPPPAGKFGEYGAFGLYDILCVIAGFALKHIEKKLH